MGGNHGTTTSITEMKSGIGISMRKLNKIDIHEDGKTARMGGGLKVGEVKNVLTPANKYSRA